MVDDETGNSVDKSPPLIFNPSPFLPHIYYYIMRTILLPLFLFMPLIVSAQSTLTEQNQKFARQLHILNRVLSNLDVYYVDTLDAKKVIDEGIQYMLYNLDPYTQYIPEEESKEFLESTTGKYAGIGSPISFHSDQNRCVFSNPYEGMPAAEAGVRSGDVILEVDGEDLKRKEGEVPADYSSRVTSKLRGDAGTTFKLKVKRPGVDGDVVLTLTRRVIEVSPVPYYGMLDEEVGVIVVNSFMENTARDVRRAFVALKQQGMMRLLLDLRGNPGGLISEAVDVVGFFMPNGTKVVTTKGKVAEFKEDFATSDEPLDTKIPLVVLVDDGSASASEIMAGALQDYDRAVVVGERTYGKGLVQQSLGLPYGGILKYTSSKYYIPSGRCIQAYDFKNRGEDGRPQHLPDSLAKTFYTAAGRPVKDGGGVMPDSVIVADSVANFAYDLLTHNVVEDFAAYYRNTHPEPAMDTYAFTDADFEAFKQYVAASTFKYKPRSQRLLDVLAEGLKKEGYEAATEIEALRKVLTPNLDIDMESHKTQICDFLECLIAMNYYGLSKSYVFKLRKDSVVQKAVQLVRDDKLCKQLLRK